MYFSFLLVNCCVSSDESAAPEVLRPSYVVSFETRALLPIGVIASPRPTSYVLRSQAMSPLRGSDPGTRGRRPPPHGLGPAAPEAAEARSRAARTGGGSALP